MDQFDLKILELVQRNNRLPAERIADEVGLSPSAVQRRLRRLRDEGVIEADVSVIAPEMVGRRLLVIVSVTLERDERPIYEETKRSFAAAPEVMQCYAVAGETDFILIVAVHDIEEYNAFTQRLFFANPHIKRFQTHVVTQRVKSGFAVLLDKAPLGIDKPQG
jgi:Lrp/AsnC family leucine-responsive transcriptional regulator